MTGWTFGAHAFWAAAVAVTCAVEPAGACGDWGAASGVVAR